MIRVNERQRQDCGIICSMLGTLELTEELTEIL